MCNNCGDCKNKVDQVVPSGYLSKVVQSPCGSTSIHGHELVCDECVKNCGRPWYICATCGRDCSEYDCLCDE